MTEQSNISFSFIDLFAGIGGFRLALNNLGGACLNFSEISKDAINTYCTNFDEDISYNLGDITKTKSLPKHDLLTAGVPCQSWSIAGKNLGFNDDRGQLWNDTIFLLNQSKPKAFIFENVKGLVDPRNKEALSYILKRIKEAGYFVDYYILNSSNYGVPQNRIRVYIIGFVEECFHNKFRLPKPIEKKVQLADILDIDKSNWKNSHFINQKNLFGETVSRRYMSLSNNNGFNDYFLFNDLRNGHSTIHSWDILPTSEKQKDICLLLLKNRRKNAYGLLDGNPLSLHHFKALNKSITADELNELVRIGILLKEEYSFLVSDYEETNVAKEERLLLNFAINKAFNIDALKNKKALKMSKSSILKNIESLKQKGVLSCTEIRYDFKNTKISTGLNGINRVFLPSSSIYPTLVASDSNDFIALMDIKAKTSEEFKSNFLELIYKKKLYRKITKEEACLIQGFPKNFSLPESRPRWMKLIGNSVSAPVIQVLGKAIIETGVFNPTDSNKVFTKEELQYAQ